MKFSALPLAAIAALPFAVANANDALRLSDGHFSWAYSASFEGLSGDPNTPACIDAFDAAFVAAYNEANAGGDVHAESCSVTSVSPSTSDMLRGSYDYNGQGDYRYVLCLSIVLVVVFLHSKSLLTHSIPSLFHSFQSLQLPSLQSKLCSGLFRRWYRPCSHER